MNYWDREQRQAQSRGESTERQDKYGAGIPQGTLEAENRKTA